MSTTDKARLRLWEQIGPLLLQLQRAPGDVATRELLKLWDEQLLQGWPRAECYRHMRDKAQEYEERLEELRRWADQPVSMSGERGVIRAADQLPADFSHELAARVRLARQRLEAVSKIDANSSDETILRAAEELEKLEANTLIDAFRQQLIASAQQRNKLAQQQQHLIQELQELPKDLPVKERDQALLRIWNPATLEGCQQADEWRTPYNEACQRQELLGQLKTAAAEENRTEVAKILTHPLIIRYPHPPEIESVVGAAKLEKLQELIQALRDNDSDRFREQFDFEVVREFHLLFQVFKQRLDEWLTKEFQKPDVNPTESCAEPLTREKGYNYRVRWKWPGSEFVSECIIGVVSKAQEDPDTENNSSSIRPGLEDIQIVARREYDRGVPYWNVRNNACLYVYSQLDLKVTQHFGKPLKLGTLAEAK